MTEYKCNNYDRKGMEIECCREDESLVRQRIMAPVRAKMAALFADRLAIRSEMASLEVRVHHHIIITSPHHDVITSYHI